METADEGTDTGSLDEQLGSPGFTFEKGWLGGIILGFVAIVVMVRRGARRRRDNGAPGAGPAGEP